MINKEEIAKILLKIKAVTLRANPPYKWVSGILAPIYTDNRLLISYPEEREKIVDGFAKAIKSNTIKVDVVAGIATSGVPWSAWVAEKLKLPMVYIRKRSKEHGKENLIEGKLDRGRNVAIIEDLVSTGGSSISGVEAVREHGCKVDCCLAIFTYEMEAARKNFEKAKVKLVTLTNFSTLVNVAVKQSYLNEEDRANVLEWVKNPEQWGK